MGKLQINGNLSASGTISSGNGGLVMSTSGSLATYLSATGGWARGWGYNINDTSVGGFGLYGSSTTVNYFYVGSYDTPWMKATPAGVVTATTFSGSLSGNASTATKLKTARTISLTGSVTGSGSFDGSGNLSIATTTNHTHSYQPIESTTFSISNTTYVSVRTPNRTAAMYYEFWDSVGWAGIRAGDIYDNNNRVLSAGNYTSYTVTKTGSGASGTWGINITGSAGSVAWGNVTGKPSTFTPSSHSHSYIEYMDTRANNQSPNDLQAGLTIHLKTNGTDGLSDGGSYHAVVGIKDWGDYSGGPYGQISITANQNMWFRASTSGTSWGSWNLLLDHTNYSSYALPITGGTMTGLLNITTNGITTTIGAQNNGHVHIYSSSAVPFVFNQSVAVMGYLSIYDMNSKGCGSSFPSSPSKGQIFFKI